MDSGRTCRRCGVGDRKWWRRGLCWRCYRSLTIRGQYATLGSDLDDLATGRDLIGEAAPCPGPLPGKPRSPERLAECQRRYERRQAFWPAPAAAGTGPGDSGPAGGCGGLPLERIAELFGVAGMAS